MKRKNRNLDGKTKEHEPEEKFFKRERVTENRNLLINEFTALKSKNVERINSFTCCIVKSNDTYKHEDRAKEGIKKEFNRSVFSVLSTPNTDEEEHWKKH